jgi:hypothetical protein
LRTPTQKLKATIAGIGLLAALALGPAGAIAAPGGAAPPGYESPPVAGGGYVNPFATGSWSVSRTDMGVDYMPNMREPVPAIGKAKILGASMKSGWPGGAPACWEETMPAPSSTSPST